MQSSSDSLNKSHRYPSFGHSQFSRRTSISSQYSSSSSQYSESSCEEYEIDPLEGTNFDAATSKASATSSGYLNDPYILKLLNHQYNSGLKRLPLINRGTFVRVTILDSIIKAFIHFHRPSNVQIISLGAGWDSRWFNLVSSGLAPAKYFEIDFENILKRKQRKMSKFIKEKSSNQAKIEFVYGDLRDFEKDIVPQLQTKGFDPTAPTLILSEIVLVYLQSLEGNKIIEWFAKNLVVPSTNLTSSTSVCYQSENSLYTENINLGYHCFLTLEQVRPNDPFGQMMCRNLHDRGILLQSISDFPTMTSQRDRYIKYGWKDVTLFDMNEGYKKYISEEEKSRISKLEILDEVEEWNLLCSHYCFVVAILY